MGTLAQCSPDILDVNNNVKEKDEIRNITHLHHAVDACVIGLIPILIPSGDNGAIWKMLVKRHISVAEKTLPILIRIDKSFPIIKTN